MIARLLRDLRRPLDPERRASIAILVAARWFLIAIAVFTVNYRPGVGVTIVAGLDALIVGAALFNVLLQRRLRGGAPIALGLPLLASVYDAVGITIAIALVDGFRNDSFVLYYPALLAISVVFPGRWSVAYAGASIAGYLCASLPRYGDLPRLDSFESGDAGDQRVLVLRLAAMAATVLIANLVIRIERDRRERAVAAESARAAEVRELERRARDAERTAEEERRRLSQEVHDGIAQEIYMLTLGLETVAAVAAEAPNDDRTRERLDALVRLSKRTLLDTRNLLFDLGQVMAGEVELAALVRNQAREFAAVTDIAVDVCVRGVERPLSAVAVGEVYRVVQEGLANIYRHAHARFAGVELSYAERALTLTITDDGQGFDPGDERPRGHGLASMRERAARLGGSLAIAAAPGSGTTLTVVVPYEECADAADARATG